MSDRLQKIITWVLRIGIVVSVLIVVLIYGPILLLGIKYRLNRDSYKVNDQLLTSTYINSAESDIPNEISADVEYIKTLNSQKQFGIVIPAIGVKALVKKNIDPYDPDEYMPALTDAVAHAKGTKAPGGGGKIFIFAHSAMNFYRMTTQNIDFYLINDLEINDKVILTYEGKTYMYEVTKSKFVPPTQIEELTEDTETETLILMTCWPPGVDLKRLIVTAKPLP